MKKLVTIKGMSYLYDHRKTDGISDVSFNILKGEVMSLLGPSGSGKTTILKCLAGKLSPQEGSIHFHSDISISYIDSHSSLEKEKTIFENLDDSLRSYVDDRIQRENQIRSTLALLEMTNEIDSLVKEISEGQKQRTIIALALIKNPDFLLLDEPFSNLDNILRQELLDTLFELFKEKGISVIWVTHNSEEALSYSQKIILLNYGVIQQTGSPKELYYQPKNLFTSQFFTQTNIFPVTILEASPTKAIVRFLGENISISPSLSIKETRDQSALLVIHPEHIKQNEKSKMKGNIIKKVFKGSQTLVFFKFKELTFTAEIFSANIPSGLEFSFEFDNENLYCLNEL